MTKLAESLKLFLNKAFDIRDGEYQTAILMQLNIFLLISTLLIVKPTVNALFLSKFGAERLPEAFILVALTAILTTTLYAKRLSGSSLNRMIEQTLLISVIILIFLGISLYTNFLGGYVLYFFYIWVAIFAVMSSSQFWILANLVYNVREAKRLFGFIGAGAISGGIFGGYLTSVMAPLIGTENLVFIAAIFLIACIPITRFIWKSKVAPLNVYKRKRRSVGFGEHPIRIIKNSKHLTYLALIIGVSVLVAKLVDYQFSDVASREIQDPDELAAFFGFWFSNLNLISLLIQLFLTSRLVGVWGIGTSLLILPAGIFMGALSFLMLPELAAAILIKSADGSLKQSVNRSAIELLSLPIPQEIKNRTKTFIDVVVDSVATGLAGIILIFIVNGLGWNSKEISLAIVILLLVWIYIAYLIRIEYINQFKANVGITKEKVAKETKKKVPTKSVISGIRKVLTTGGESQLVYMLKKTKELKDDRFIERFKTLIYHDSSEVRALALENLELYKNDFTKDVEALIFDQSPKVSLAAFQYLFGRSPGHIQKLLQQYLNHQNQYVADNALLCLAIETRNNPVLRKTFNLENRIQKKIAKIKETKSEDEIIYLLQILGAANIDKFNPSIASYFSDGNSTIVKAAIINAGKTFNPEFIPLIVNSLAIKHYREEAKEALVGYGVAIIDQLLSMMEKKSLDHEVMRIIPAVIESFNYQKAVSALFQIQDGKDLAVSIEALRSLNKLKAKYPTLQFNKQAIVDRILLTCQLYQNTLSAMHAQIIVSFKKRNVKKTLPEQDDARRSLIDLLERRLDGDLERIFRLLGLRYPFDDIFAAYEGIIDNRNELRINALEYLDNLLDSNLKRVLVPIIETTIIDIDEANFRKLNMNIPSEYECFKTLLQGHDQRIKLAVFYLIRLLNDKQYLSLLTPYLADENVKIKAFANEAYQKLTI